MQLCLIAESLRTVFASAVYQNGCSLTGSCACSHDEAQWEHGDAPRGGTLSSTF